LGDLTHFEMSYKPFGALTAKKCDPTPFGLPKIAQKTIILNSDKKTIF
jgi:hypothetical protein